jgi:predicted deacylase
MPADSLIQSITIAGQTPGPRLLITGGVHGDEFEPMAALRKLRRSVTPSELKGTLTLAPVVNEAAMQRMARTADDGLDLARTCPGRADGSITQRTAAELTQLIEAADYYIDLHTGGNIYDIMPLSGYVLHNDAKVLDAQRRMAEAFNMQLIWGTSPNLQGRSLSVARDANVPGIYAEWRGEGRLRPEGVEAYHAGCLNVMAMLGMIDHPQPASELRYWVEDPTDQSGHLQVQNPSPRDGCFEPCVKIGDRVRAGDIIGKVSDVLGDNVAEARATNDGVVILLRTFAYVNANDALAAIVDVDRFERKP